MKHTATKVNKEVHESLKKDREDIKNSKHYPEMRAMYHKLISKPPYYFTIEYARMNKASIVFATKDSQLHKARWGKVLEQEASKDVNEELRLVEIDKDMIPMIASTKNELFYRPLFFPSIFVNCDFEFEGITIRGFLIVDHDQIPEAQGKHDLKDMKDWTIFCVAIDIEEHSEFYANFKLLGGNVYKSEYHEFEHERQRCHRMNDYVRQLAVNVVDLVTGNDEELDVVTVEMTRNQNLKRIKRGKLQLPTKIFIKPKQQFRRVYIDFNKNIERFGIGHKFMVRGFWRHYRSERYKEKQGTKKWIKAFWKGKGIAISKDYKIK